MEIDRHATGEPCAQCERRANPRHALRSLAVVTRGDVVDAARIEDIGVNGVRIHECSGEPLRSGMSLALRFQLPHMPDPIEIEGTVRWVLGADDRCAGIAFARGLRAREAWAIAQLPRVLASIADQ